ncbi:GINS complex, subunit Psf2 [Ostreococcus tauri]|uniref:GINS complex, subunit Psf2 n=1 Tax=Ostreococcus tauri TaxID=70448 RepID=A0A090M7A5_OSTTA|nr:GINS complex, subunit Psf2 [Ostreococcus tauri]CEG00923.1 GINS complex, subunit Psf2 [Ostreococcus tauri]|eukprot:XP_022840673.1 GINS complex, subunit Psf2 [Ostreococcus tauri]
MSFERTFKPEETSYVAQDTMVQILPRFRCDRVPFLADEFGPFMPNVPVLVPCWLALALNENGKCTVELGDWFAAESVLATQKNEKTDTKGFQPLPQYFIEQARCISKYVTEDMSMHVHLEHILSLRQSKIRRAFRLLRHDTMRETIEEGYRLPSETACSEFNSIRRFTCAAMDNFNELLASKVS